MHLQPALFPYLGIAAVLGVVLLWVLERERRRLSRSFRSSSQVLALGLPAVPTKFSSSAERGKVIAEFRSIGEDFSRHHVAIRKGWSDFFLSKGIQLSDPSGKSRFIAQPSRLLACDVILGESVASADLTPGTAIYWQRIPGRKLESAVKADPSIAADLSAGLARTLVVGDFRIEMRLDGARIIDLRSDGLGDTQLERGTPILLSLDDDSETALEEAFGGEAPARGTSRKVRLFGGFSVDEIGAGLEIIPYRQQPGMDVAKKGRLHPLSNLLGVVVGEMKDKAFVWAPSKSVARRQHDEHIPPMAIAAFNSVH